MANKRGPRRRAAAAAVVNARRGRPRSFAPPDTLTPDESSDVTLLLDGELCVAGELDNLESVALHQVTRCKRKTLAPRDGVDKMFFEV